MSGTIDYSVLLPQDLNSSGGSLLQALYGGGTSSAQSPADALAALKLAETNQDSAVASVAKQPTVARDVAAFNAAVTSATSVDALLANPVVLKVLLTANGLGDQISYTALAKKALTSNLSDSSSLANTLPNSAWKKAASTYQFSSVGLAVIQQPGVLQTIANAYAEVSWRQSLDAAHPGLSNALTFRSEASSVTGTLQILGDPVLRDVVTTALGVPKEIAFQSLEAQQKAISSQLDVTQFQSPSFVEQFAQRYLIAKAGAATTDAQPSLDSLAAGLVV